MSVVSLTALTTLLWYCAGVATSLVTIVAGLSAGQEERGKVFGILTVAVSLGALIGGLSMGAIVDRWGFPTLFSVAAGVLALWPLFGLLVADVKAEPKPVTGRPQPAAGEPPAAESSARPLGSGFYFFLAAAVLSSTSGFFFLLGRSLLMNGLGFSALALASTNAASNALAMPLPMLLGSLSDRTGRKRYLVAGYVLGVAALAILSGSSLLWQFMIASVLVVVPLRTSGLGLALVTDLVPRPSLSRALAWAGSARWIGGILGYAGAGAAFQRLGTGATLAIGMALSAIPIVLLVFARKRAPAALSEACEMAIASGVPAPVGC